MNIKSKNLKEFKSIAKKFIDTIIKYGPKKSEATIVGLYGDLGVGKTTFTQEVAKNLGIKRIVNSPTFVIMKSYSIPDKTCYGVGKLKAKNYKLFYHIDAYRLKNEKELEKLGWKDLISNPKNLIFVEWPENVKKAMPKKHHKVLISHVKEGHRKFKIKSI